MSVFKALSTNLAFLQCTLNAKFSVTGAALTGVTAINITAVMLTWIV